MSPGTLPGYAVAGNAESLYWVVVYLMNTNSVTRMALGKFMRAWVQGRAPSVPFLITD